MKNLLNPKWLFVINIVPIAILLFLSFEQFSLIQSLLNTHSIQLWKNFGLILMILCLSNLAYAIYLSIKKENIPFSYSIILFISYFSFIYIFGFYSNDLIPFSIPRWMQTDSIIMYMGTFIMPTLIYSLFLIVIHFTSTDKEYRALPNFIFAIGIPLFGYLFMHTILPVWLTGADGYNTHVLVILIFVGITIFLFFIIRGVYILTLKNSDSLKKYQLAWKIPFAIILPLTGLLINNGYFLKGLGDINNSHSGIFGNFNDLWFYILAVLNGIFICMPEKDNKIYRLCLFVARSITFAYTLYFFLVFLPYLPLSVFAIILVGLGFLMLAPLILFVIHVNELSNDYTFLKSLYSKKFLVTISIMGFLSIPIYITANYLNNKRALNEGLQYLYSPDYSKKYDIDTTSLRRTLHTVEINKNGIGNGFSEKQIPYLSSYYNWLVLDNLTLSDSKIQYARQVFFGELYPERAPENIQNQNVAITAISSKSTYDKSQNAWRSWVDLEITNSNTDNVFKEYATTIDLPDGCWISDYYLYVLDKKEFGLLAEKKSAMWIYSNIRNINKDPGILHYLSGNKVAFRVFPFTKNEVRKTGIEFLHKEPIELTFDDNKIQLGNSNETLQEKIENEHVAYVSAQQKQTLKSVRRQPYFHFLVDVSKQSKEHASELSNRLKDLVNKNSELAKNAKISFVNSYVSTYSLDNNWEQNFQSQNFEGGFYLERAITTALLNGRTSNSYPVLVVLTDNLNDAVLESDFSDLKFAFPESDFFYNLAKNGNLKKHSLVVGPLSVWAETKEECQFCESVLAYPIAENNVAYLPKNNMPSIVLKKPIFQTTAIDFKEKNWLSALTMQAQWRSQIIHPETAEKGWLDLVKNSFISKVMTPVTSYLVLENEAQKAVLKKKQKQVLSGNKSLDPDEDPSRMSEPSLWILGILLGLVIWFRRKKLLIN